MTQCTNECFRVDRDSGSTRMTVVKTCDHPAPRLFEDDPMTIRVVTMSGPAWDDPLAQFVSAAFKTQCAECRELFAAWAKLLEPVDIPSDDAIREKGKRLLVSSGFRVESDGVVCPDCLEPGVEHTAVAPLRLAEGIVPAPTQEWLA